MCEALQGAVSRQARSKLAILSPRHSLWLPGCFLLGTRLWPFGLLSISQPSGMAFSSSVIFGNSLNHSVTQSNASGKSGMTQTPGNTAVAPDWPFSANSSRVLERRSGWGERMGRV